MSSGVSSVDADTECQASFCPSAKPMHKTRASVLVLAKKIAGCHCYLQGRFCTHMQDTASTLGIVTDTLCQVRATSWLRQGARIPAKAGENCLPAPARGSLAVLIDGDNVSPTSLQSVLQATPQSYGCKLACK